MKSTWLHFQEMIPREEVTLSAEPSKFPRSFYLEALSDNRMSFQNISDYFQSLNLFSCI